MLLHISAEHCSHFQGAISVVQCAIGVVEVNGEILKRISVISSLHSMIKSVSKLRNK